MLEIEKGMLKIDKGFKFPTGRYSRHHQTELLRQMDVGDSVFFPFEESMRSNGVVIRNRYYTPASRLGMSIKVRKVDNGYRMWRVS